MMQMFINNDEVAKMEAALTVLYEDARLSMLANLAWHLRERDTRRALALVEEASLLCTTSKLSASEQKKIQARLHLCTGVAKLLFGDSEAASHQAELALQIYQSEQEFIGVADSNWLLAWIAHDRGQAVVRNRHFEAMAEVALKADDQLRYRIAQVELARSDAFQDVELAEKRWGAIIPLDTSQLPPALAAGINNYLSALASMKSDFGHATAYGILTYEAALESGQLRRAIMAATNIGDDFNNLNDHHAALEWMQRGLDLARPTGWPQSISSCLVQTAGTLRSLGRLEAAQELLQRALQTLGPRANSRSYAIALQYQGDLALDRNDYKLALETFLHLQQCAEALDQDDVKSMAYSGQAHALSQLGQPETALAAALTALNLARHKNNGPRQIAALRILAEIHTGHTLPAPENMTALNPPLHYLQQALTIADNIEGYTIPGDLLDAIGYEYAKVGAYAQAYHIGLQANAARAKIHSQEATNRAIAMQVQHQTERAHSDSEHHRQLATLEAKRAQFLQQTNDTLERLSAIGREITAHLDTTTVFQMLNRHVHGLLDVTAFAVYMIDNDGLHINRAFGIEGEQILPPNKIPLSDPNSVSARCVREKREILINRECGDDALKLVPGTLDNLTLLFAPLMTGDKVLGVMTIQSIAAHAYAERERLIFRSLCAYGAIALDNAATYQALQRAQAQLVAQEKLVAQQKLAALGALVAGIAHELNTPLGNTLMMASAMQDNVHELNSKLSEQCLQRSDLIEYINDAQEATTLIIRGLTNATALVNNFKQIAVDRATAYRKMFNLRQTLQEIVASMIRKIHSLGHDIELDVPEEITMNSYPGSLGQVIANLISNALLHAFEGRSGGKLLLSAQQQETGRVQIRLSDNGVGIAAQNLTRIFDPFFTTKMGQGGNGLGLNISYNIVTSLLNGQISAASTYGEGATFLLDLPLTAAEQ